MAPPADPPDTTDDTSIDNPSVSPPSHPYNLRTNRERSYSHRLDHNMDDPPNSKSYEQSSSFVQLQTATEQYFSDGNVKPLQRAVTGFIFNQMSAKAGIKKHGRRAVEVLYNEFLQLNNKDVFEALNASSLSKEEKQGALRAINLVKEKRDGSLKGRTVADGRKQRDLYDKADTTSPTVSVDALLLTLIVDAYEGRDVAICDIAGAYLNALMDEFVVMKLEGDMVDIFCEMDPSFRKFVVMEGGKQVLYLRLHKALYGCVKAALLWYDLYSTTLVHMGYKINAYDPCVANKIIEGTQSTIVWYVDDNKISHQSYDVNTETIRAIESHFGAMTITRGDEHEFLGMKLRFDRKQRTVRVSMKSYIEEAICSFEETGEKVSHSVRTPAAKNLFTRYDDEVELNEKTAAIFHSVTAKLLYVATRARADVLLPVAFLCTRVRDSTDADWRKLKRVLGFLYGTIDDELVLGAKNLHQLFTWVDAAYAVHDDFKSHTGGTMSMGIGTFCNKSSKQKLNTKSSTEAEVVGASDYLTFTIWMRNFLRCQGIELDENIFYQDNQSAMRIEKNGIKSVGQKSKHIHCRYFFVKDRIENDKIKIEYCPTSVMIADFFTKPLQGNLFHRLRAVILGHAPIDSLTAPTHV